METDFDCEVVISEVKKYPLIYDKDDENYNNRKARDDAWNKITELVVGEEKFAELEEGEKNELCRRMQRKWKALRDAYQRSLRTQSLKSGASKRRPYLYQRQMAFLHLPVMANPQTSEDMEEEEEESIAPEVEDDHEPEEDVPMRAVKREPARKSKEGNFKTQLIDILKSQQSSDPAPSTSDDDDDNKMFLLSLLPRMRQLSPNVSFEFRIKVMQYLQECYTKSLFFENAVPNTSTSRQKR